MEKPKIQSNLSLNGATELNPALQGWVIE